MQTTNLSIKFNSATSLYAVYIALGLIFLWFGGMKFTQYEAEAIHGLVANSPFLSWLSGVLSVTATSKLIGIVELIIGFLLIARIKSPSLSKLGAIGAMITFVLTFSLFFSTPGVVLESGFPAISVLPGQFLLKDLGLLALSYLLYTESSQA